MANKPATRGELLDRWRGIEEEEENADDDLKLRRLHLHKEKWFSPISPSPSPPRETIN